MGQDANKRRVKDNEARAVARYLRTSPQKLNLVAQTIRGKDAGRALIDLPPPDRQWGVTGQNPSQARPAC